jgi:hypothetical protein
MKRAEQIVEPERSQRACHRKTRMLFVVDRRPVNSTVRRLRMIMEDLNYG